MKIRASLHCHTKGDPLDADISYTGKDLINEAKKKGISAVAITPHGAFGYTEELAAYAKAQNMLLIPGIEQNIEGRHVLILGCKKDIESVRSFKALRAYKKKYPEICVVAAHPYFPSRISLHKKLEEYIDLFDAIEKSWFYTKYIDFNRRAEKIAKRASLPYLATSDIHDLQYMKRSYIELEVPEMSTEAVIRSIKEGDFENISRPARFWYDMVWRIGIQMVLRNPMNLLRRR